MKTTKPADPTNTNELTPRQLAAVDLLAAGRNDTETAAAIGVNRVSVTRWRCYGPQFRAELARRRSDIWGSAAARLQALIPKAIDTLAAALENGPPEDRPALALTLLKLVPPPAAPVGSTDPEEYVQADCEREREEFRTVFDEMSDDAEGLPGYAEHLERVRKRLSELEADTEAVSTINSEAGS